MSIRNEKTLIIQDPVLKKGFTSIPNSVMYAKGLSMAAKYLYGLLLSFAWQEDECWPGQDRLAEAADCTTKTVRKYLGELKDYGLIDWKRRGLNMPNIYYILDLSGVKALQNADGKGRSGPEGKGCTVPDGKGRSVQERKGRSDKEYSFKNTQYSSSIINNTTTENIGIEEMNDSARRSAMELTRAYRDIEGIVPGDGDFSFIGGLLKRYGYKAVRQAVDELELAIMAKEIECPLMYMKSIVESGVRKTTRDYEQEKEKRRKRELIRQLYLS